MSTNKITRGLVFFFGLFFMASGIITYKTAHSALLLIALGSFFVAAEISEILKYLDKISKRLEKIESMPDAGKDNKDKKQDEGAK